MQVMNLEDKKRWQRIGIDIVGWAGAALLIWLLTWVFLDEPLERVVGIVLLAGGILVGLGSKRMFPGKHPKWIKASVTAVFVGAAFWVQLPPAPETEIQWRAYSVEAIEQAARDGKPVVIDFYADWCPPCIELDTRVFSRDEVAEELDRFVRLRADLSDQRSAENARISERHSVAALPTVVFIGSDGQERLSMRLLGYESASRFVARAKAVQ